MALETFGSDGNAFERAVTYPARATGRILGPLPKDAIDSIKREGPVGGLLDTGVHLTGRVGKEVLNATTGIVGYTLGKTRQLILGTLGYAGRITWKAARNAEIIPLVSSPQQQMALRERYPYADPDELAIRGVLDRISSLGQPTRPETRNPDNQPRT